MSLPTDNHDGSIEARLRSSADGFPGVAPAGTTLEAVVARGRRGRTVGRAARLGVAGTLVAGVAFAAPAILERTQNQATVLNHLDEEVPRDEVVDVAPSITVVSPRDNTIVTDPLVSFSGEVDPRADVTVGPFDVDVAPDGRWRIDLELEPGTQTLTFWATDSLGNRGFDEVTITLAEPRGEATGGETDGESVEEPVAEEPAPEPAPVVIPVKDDPEPAPAEPKPAAQTHAFTANQKYGSCSEEVPYDEFNGTAKPGTQVWVWSEYGQKEVAVDGNGNWFAHVEFPTAPQGVPFQVKAKSLHTGEKIWFEFVNTGSGGGHQGDQVAFSADMENNNVEYDPPYSYFSGTATPGTKVWVESEHGGNHVTADGAGNWRVKVWFEQAPYGTNTWAVVVEGQPEGRKVFEFTGTRPEPEPEPEEVAFTSDQIHDVTDDDPPHSLYAGTVTPGDKIFIHNEYGEAYVLADENGNWSLWVEFPGAPRGQTMTVNVKHWQTGETHTHQLEVI